MHKAQTPKYNFQFAAGQVKHKLLKAQNTTPLCFWPLCFGSCVLCFLRGLVLNLEFRTPNLQKREAGFTPSLKNGVVPQRISVLRSFLQSVIINTRQLFNMIGRHRNVSQLPRPQGALKLARIPYPPELHSRQDIKSVSRKYGIAHSNLTIVRDGAVTTPFFSAGFTMVEVMIMLAIITLISSIVLVSFPSVLSTINTQRSAQRFAIALRQAQNQALAVRTIQGPIGPVVPSALGINVDLDSPGNFLFFADMDLDHIYTAGGDIIIETVALEFGVSITEILDEARRSRTVLNSVFTAPTAEATLYNDSESIGQSVEIKFRPEGGAGVDRTVKIHISGQISVE